MLANGSEEEVEIRGCSIEAVELVTAAISEMKTADDKDLHINAILVDHFLWDYRRQHAEQLDVIPFHQTRCIYYWARFFFRSLLFAITLWHMVMYKFMIQYVIKLEYIETSYFVFSYGTGTYGANKEIINFAIRSYTISFKSNIDDYNS